MLFLKAARDFGDLENMLVVKIGDFAHSTNRLGSVGSRSVNGFLQSVKICINILQCLSIVKLCLLEQLVRLEDKSASG